MGKSSAEIAHGGLDHSQERRAVFSREPSEQLALELGNSLLASGEDAPALAVSAAGSVLRLLGCGSRLMKPLRSSAWITSLIDCGVMNARRASCDVDSGAPWRSRMLSVVNWSVVRPYGATCSLTPANTRCCRRAIA